MYRVLIKSIRLLCLLNLLTAALHAQQAQTAVAQKRPSEHVNENLPRWLKLTGEYRMRVEGINGNAYRPEASDAFALSRVRLNVTFTPQSWLRTTFQAQDAQVIGRNAKPDAPPFENTFDLRQAYVELGNVEGGKFALRAGRQELVFGEQRLLGHANWVNVARSFDAVRASYRTADFGVDAFAASVVVPREGEFDKRADGNNLHGIYGAFNKVVPMASVEPYALWRVAPGTDFKTIGFRWTGKLPASFDYGVEIAGQTGSLGTEDVEAWAGHWITGYTLSKVKFTPRIVAEYNYASGDADPTDGKRGTFDQLYATAHDKYGLADQVGWRNLHDVRSGVEMKLTPKLSFSGFYHSWWLADTHDGLYNAAGALVARVASGTAGRHIGHEADFQAVYALNNLIQLGAGYAHIFPGTFLKNTTSGKAHDFSYVTISYLF